jgi:uncharacterized repeat protein (TIGR03803 family)
MKTLYGCRTILSAFCVFGAGAAATPSQVAFRVVADMQQYSQAAGLTQPSPDLFYLQAGQAILSVTPQGKLTVLATAPASYVMGSPPVTAANSRSYTAYGAAQTNYPISFKFTPGSLETYPAVALGPGFIHGLPDGTLFGTAGEFSTGLYYLITGDQAGKITTIYRFPSGEVPMSPIYASDGNYYGVSWANGGPHAGASYIFQVTPRGVPAKVVDLPGGSFGSGHSGSFFQGADGNFYGTTAAGGATGGGTLYQATMAGHYRVIYSFGSGVHSRPGTTFQGSDGNFYGVTRGATGPASFGEIFQLTQAGRYTGLHLMDDSDGVCPCWLMQASDGILYGTAVAGGRSGIGTVFALDAGLPKPAPRALSFTPQSGGVGKQVRIWGYHLLSAVVQFNGTAAAVVSNAGSNYLWATVPAGATSGPIKVTTPGGTSKTTASFTVK